MAGDDADPRHAAQRSTDPRDDVSEDEAAAWDDRAAASPSRSASADRPGGAGSSFDDDDFELERSSEIDDITESMVRPVVDASSAPTGAAGAAGSAGPPARDIEAELEAEVHEIESDVHALVAERDQFKAMAQRIQADFDNYRKRAAAQSIAESDRATGRLAEALLPVLDAAEAAYLTHPDEVGPLLNQMLTELKRHGLEVLDLDGKPFDPEFAEAVAHEPGEGGEPMVVEVLRSGYSWKDKTLRPAMVRTKD